ncbi:MAG TPA: hypothetical protein VG265_05795 [Gaiellaceae bacterium]|jgi:hypothetical protein|nr:hypothetical protein [Gaiellaceae bacterium]
MPTPEDGLTAVGHIDAAIARTRAQFPKPGVQRTYGRELAIAITHLDTARLFVNKGLASKAGLETVTDAERLFADALEAQNSRELDESLNRRVG